MLFPFPSYVRRIWGTLATALCHANTDGVAQVISGDRIVYLHFQENKYASCFITVGEDKQQTTHAGE